MNMQAIKRKYWGFYIMGRQERRLRIQDAFGVGTPAEEAIAKRVFDAEEASLREVVRQACAEVAKASLSEGARKRWTTKHYAEIKETDADPSEAYEAWCAGRIDELACAIEDGVVDALSEMVFEDDEDEG
jgi:hypothetical protein